MSTVNGRYEPGDQAVGGDGVEAPVRPVLGGRRRLRQQGGLIAVAVVAITVVLAGIGVGGHETESLTEASASRTSPASSVASSRPSGGPLPSPTETADADCVPVVPGRVPVPEILLGSTAGTTAPRIGLTGPPDWALSSPGTLAWPVPTEEAAIPLELRASLVVVPSGRACLTHVVADYLGVDELGRSPAPFGIGAVDLDPPRSRLVLGSLPSGDFIVRVAASYSTGAAGTEEPPVIERFFRVDSAATPLVTSTVACLPLASGAPAPRLVLVSGAGQPVLGVDTATYPGDVLHNGAIVRGTFPDAIELRVAGDACATSWSIEIVDQVNGSTYFQVGQDNPGEDPVHVSQNRIELTDSPLGHSVVKATVHFGPDRIATAAWELDVQGPPLPAVLVSGPDGEVVTALPGCGAGWTLGSGRSGFELCTTAGMPATLGLLTVHSGEIVSAQVEGGWDLVGWNVSCGSRSSTSASDIVSLANCNLGGGGDGISPTGPARFIPFPGRTIVWISVNAIQLGDVMYAQYYLEIEATP